ncbi:MAG: TetR family transcriptional regulator [Planctomycetia bacterium]|nr:TetR family transcriptional regulator [Planctomycetia bacterium]
MKAELSERQKEIINASLELIAEGGIQSLTIKNLSKKIGLVESAIYRHYESKTQILIAILDIISEQTKLYETKEVKSIIDFLEKRFENHFMTFTKNPALVSVVFAEDLFQNEPLLAAKTRLKVEKSVSELTALIQKGQQSGEIRKDIDSEIISVMINGSIRMLVKQWKMSDYSFDLAAKGKELIKSFRVLLK